MSDPVLIVGAGPTGLTAALELARLEVPVRIIDKRSRPLTTTRAIGVQSRTLELLHQRGLAEELVRIGHPGRGGCVYGGGSRIFRLDFARIDSRYPFILLVSQAETERVLREAIAKRGVSVERGVELVAFSQDTHAPERPITAILRHPDGGMETFGASWLVASEGAHSLIRSTLDLPFEGETFTDAYILGDLHLDGDLSADDLHIFSSEHGFMALFPMGGDHYRLIASESGNAPGQEVPPTLEMIQTIYDQRSHIPARLRDMSWSSWFHINSRMVSRLKVGRLLLGGDAAHIHSPAGAQGMNTGIQDMINLGWKLALVMHGQAAAGLLNTYERDRLPVMRDVLNRTEGLTRMIGSERPWVRSLFNHLGSWIGGADVVQENATRQMAQLALNYRESPLSTNHAHGGNLRAGDRMPDIKGLIRADPGAAWQEGSLLDWLNPSRFVLLIPHPDTPETTGAVARMRDAVRSAGDLVVTLELRPPETDDPARQAFQTILGRSPSAFLVRPDGYIGLAGGEHAAPRDLAEYVNRWLIPKAATA